MITREDTIKKLLDDYFAAHGNLKLTRDAKGNYRSLINSYMGFFRKVGV
jgi:hypothetical protein